MTPHEEYERRRVDRQSRADHLARTHDWIGHARLAVFGIGALLAGILIWQLFDKEQAFAQRVLQPWWLLGPLVGFVLLIRWHGRVGRLRSRAERAARFYTQGLTRLNETWSGRGEPGLRYQNPEHPYAADLDLFGPGSLFELLCIARTRGGEDLLAAWLLNPAAAEVVRDRQTAVAELRPRLDLREDLAVLGDDIRAGLEPAALTKWAAAPRVLTSAWPRWAAYLLPLPTLLGLAAWFVFELGPVPFLITAIVQAGFGAWLRPLVERVVAHVERCGRDLALLAKTLARLEVEPMTAPRLRALRAQLDADGQPPSQRIAQLSQLIDWLDAGRNQFFLPIALLLLWRTRLAFAIEDWRGRSGPAVARWLAVVSESEALGALAGYSYEHPDDPFPEIAEDGPCFEAVAVGHPLLPAARCVRNDLTLNHDLRVLIVSGSNMSGKSTLLRTVGASAVLALAGAPVRATRLRLAQMSLGATLRIQDSLQAGRSRFYAEVVRVRQIVELAKGPVPLLFLLDEIFHGTNSHDRKQGAEAIVRGLIERGAIGLVTTHDLALAAIAEQLAPHAANVHFADHLEKGEMVFDYRMQPGIVQHSNALALMRAVGLEV